MLTLWQDLRFSFRSFTKSPGFTIVVVMTLALGIGANTAIFSVLNAAVLRPLPYPDPDKLVMIYTAFPGMNMHDFPMSAPEYLEYKEMTGAFEALGAFQVNNVSVNGAARPLRARAMLATADLWSVLGVDTHLGRTFTAEEDLPGPASNVAVLSYELWQSAFNADADLVGSTIRVNSVDLMVLGVMPRGFDLLENDAEIWLPLALDPADLGSRGGHNFRVVGRLADGMTLDRANAELPAIYERWDDVAANQHHPADSETRQHPMSVHALSIVAVGDTRPALLMLFGLVGFVLLIACANVANLLLARAEVRSRELAVRLALGAPKWRMVRQLLTESIALSMLGGIVGMLLAWWALKLMLVFIPDSVPRVDEISIDPLVLGFTMGVSLATGILFGLTPLLRISMPKLHAALKAAGSRTTDGRERHRFRNLLVITEVALALVLITGAGLMIRSFSRLQQVDPGFDPTGVMTLNLSLPEADYPENDQVIVFYNDLQREVESLPGVEHAAVAMDLPPRRSPNYNSHNIESFPNGPNDPTPNFDFMQIVSPGYFAALGITLQTGRVLDANDSPESEPILVVNRALADKFWPEADPLADRVSDWSNPPNWFRIVGVVANAKQGGIENEVGTEYFISFNQIGKFGFVPREMNLVVKVESGDPLMQLSSITGIIRNMDASLPVSNVQTMEQAVYVSIATQRFATLLLTAFGVLAALLAMVGIYSVMAFSVTQRTTEFGIRMALGARNGDVLRNVLWQGSGLAIVGIGTGLVIAFGLSKLLASQLDTLLFDLSPRDPATLVFVSSLLVVTAIVASLVPARRATRVDPMVALRYD